MVKNVKKDFKAEEGEFCKYLIKVKSACEAAESKSRSAREYRIKKEMESMKRRKEENGEEIGISLDIEWVREMITEKYKFYEKIMSIF